MPEEKSRHGCLAAWLITMIVVSVAMVPLYLLGAKNVLSDLPAWTLWLSIGMFPVNVVVALALWHWKKWGFWLDCAETVVSFVINFYAGLGFFAVFDLPEHPRIVRGAPHRWRQQGVAPTRVVSPFLRKTPLLAGRV